MVIVIQIGLRHRYAVPRIFYKLGLLSALITDSHSESFLGNCARIISRILPGVPKLNRLANRVIQDIPAQKIICHDSWIFHDFLIKTRHNSNHEVILEKREKRWGQLSIDYPFTGDEILYSMGGENLSFLLNAKVKNVKVIVDAYISPLNLRQTLEAKIVAGVSPDPQEIQHVVFEEHYSNVYKAADIILCPSQWVAEGVLALSTSFKDKIRICPYGSSLEINARPRKPVFGRIFWAGGDWFRKGLHHLADAADILKPKHPSLEFRIAGISDLEVMNNPKFKNLTFLGKLDKAAMVNEFSQADLFVFPTLSEGMASVLVEAIANGCPVLTTLASGLDNLESSGSGKYFNVGSPSDLANIIESIVFNRQKIMEMSDACLNFAATFSEIAWANRLKLIVDELRGL